MPLKLIWEAEALADLAAAAEWSPKQALAVYEAMNRMARIGWSLGRPTDPAHPNERYFPVPPLGVLYEVRGPALHVIRVLDVRRLRELP